MDPLKQPVVTAQDVGQAERDRITTFGAAVTIVGSVVYLNFRANAPGGKVVQKGLQMGLTGVEAKPGEAGRAALKVPKGTFVAGTFPSPVGFVPAEYYGLHPNFVQQALGFKSGSKPSFFSASPERIKVFEAKQAANAIFSRVTGTPNGSPSQYSPTGATIPAGPIDITPAEFGFLQSLPPGVTDAQLLLPQLAARQADFRGGASAPVLSLVGAQRRPEGLVVFRGRIVDGAVAPGSIQVELVKPINEKAIETMLKAQGIQLVLVTERADP